VPFQNADLLLRSELHSLLAPRQTANLAAQLAAQIPDKLSTQLDAQRKGASVQPRIFLGKDVKLFGP